MALCGLALGRGRTDGRALWYYCAPYPLLPLAQLAHRDAEQSCTAVISRRLNRDPVSAL